MYYHEFLWKHFSVCVSPENQKAGKDENEYIPLDKFHIYKEMNICQVALIYVDFASYLIDYVWR